MNKILRFVSSVFFICICVSLWTGGALRAAGPERSIRLAYADWSSSISSANLVKAVLQEELGIACELIRSGADRMWAAVAEGRADAMLSAWLPDTHARYYEEYADRVVDLGPNLQGTRIGLVVPDVTAGRLTAGTGLRNQPYINIDSIPEIKAHAEKFNFRIIGIEPEAGIMLKAREAIEAYGLTDFRLVEGSETAMMSELSHAIRRQKWIVITGWLPHWSFARWSLKFLEDPKGIFGGRGSIHTLVRRGLEQDMPEAYRFLNRFSWEPQDMGQLMLWIQEDDGRFPYEKALRWLRTHPRDVAEWVR